MLLSKHLPALSLLLAIGCCVSFTAAADICRVTEQGKADKNGSDWGANATTLQAALKNSHSKNCDEIWVKAGVYKPTSNNDTNISFVIERELQLYGGFVGNETKRSQRVSYPNFNTATRTILSGDIDNNDAQLIPRSTADILGSNSQRLVHFDNTVNFTSNTVIEGFTFVAASGDSGSAIACWALADNVCSPVIRYNHFIGNRANRYGGAIALNADGKLQAATVSQPVIHHNHFTKNEATVGGAISVRAAIGNQYEPTITGNSFSGNTGKNVGGAVFLTTNVSRITLTATNNTWTGNISQETTAGKGGAVYVGDAVTAEFKHETFIGNRANRGGAVYGARGSTTGMSNSIAWGNLAQANKGTIAYTEKIVLGEPVAWFFLDYSVTQSKGCFDELGNRAVDCGTNSIILDPELGNLSFHGNTLSYEPHSNSPAVDQVPTKDCTVGKDQRGLVRPQGTGCDYGAVEYAQLYEVGGTVSGLEANEFLVINNNSGTHSDNIIIEASSFFSFRFVRNYPTSSSYHISIANAPSGKTCTVSNSSGTVSNTDITNIAVTCQKTVVPKYRIGGQLSGLANAQGIVLQNGTEQLPLIQNGTFNFFTQQKTGTTYGISIKTPPSGQTCTVSNGSGTVSNADITNITVTCQTIVVPKYRIGGQLSGLANGQSVVLQNGTEQLSLTQNGAFNFATQQKTGVAYGVSIKTPPSGQTCTVSNGSGTVNASNVTNIQVKCQAKPKSGRIFSDSFEK